LEVSMIDHIGFPVSDYERSKAFYLKALAPLDYSIVMEMMQERPPREAPAAGFGAKGKPDFWIGGEGGLDKPLHVAIVAKDRATVDAFYAAAIAAGGRDKGAGDPRALSRQLLRRLRTRSRRSQYRGGVPQAGVTPVAIFAARAIARGTSRWPRRYRFPQSHARGADEPSSSRLPQGTI
jgi:catechol 2,3-dioxygenase-like lactoylglutathione lyase family enzyme